LLKARFKFESGFFGAKMCGGEACDPQAARFTTTQKTRSRAEGAASHGKCGMSLNEQRRIN